MINISSRKFQLTIAGLDCTSALISADGGFSHYESQSGLITINASFVLQKALGFTEDLNNKTNSRWARGNLITVDLCNSSNELTRSPILGHLYILKAEYDGIDDKLSIEAGCIISLLNYRSPPGNGACFPLGSQASLNSVAASLLEKAGVPSFQISLTGDGLKVPLSKMGNEAYLQLFGKLCWVNGAIAYQDNQGTVRTVPVSIAPSPLLTLQLGSDDAKFLPRTGAETPCERIRVSGVVQSLQQIPLTDSDTQEILGSGALVGLDPGTQIVTERVITREEIYTDSRIKRHYKTIQQPLGLLFPKVYPQNTNLISAEYTQETKYYELASGGGCNEPDEGRLLRHETLTIRPFGIVFAQLMENYSIPVSDITAGTEAEWKILTYTYSPPPFQGDPPPGSIVVLSNGSEVLRIESRTWLAEGSIITDPPEGLAYSTYQSLRLATLQTQIWTFQGSDRIHYKDHTQKALQLAFPEKIEEMKDAGVALTLDTYFVLVTPQDGNKTSQGKADQLQPPSPDRFPQILQIQEKPIKAEAYLPPVFGSQFRERDKNISVDGGLLTSLSQAQRIAQIEGAILWGRFDGIEASTSLRDEFFNLTPLSGINWVDLQGTTQAFLIDGASVAMTQNQLAFGFDGIWIGASLSGVITPPYKLIQQISGGDGDSCSLKVYPYDITPTETGLSGGAGDTGSLVATITEPPTTFWDWVKLSTKAEWINHTGLDSLTSYVLSIEEEEEDE